MEGMENASHHQLPIRHDADVHLAIVVGKIGDKIR